jgi:hypothetical protein
MTSVVVVEYRVRLLSIRQELLQSLGHPIIAVHGSSAAAALDLSLSRPGVIVIGHRDSLDSREALIRHFRNTVPKVPIVMLLGRDDPEFAEADYNCPADNPPRWIRTVGLALTGIQ